MGRQLTYFALPEDIAELERGLRQLGPMAVLPLRSPSRTPGDVGTMLTYEAPALIASCYVCRAEDAPSIETEYVDGQEYWSIDERFASVVKFSGFNCSVTGLSPGRLYFTDGYWGHAGQWVNKPPGFLSWAKAVLDVTAKLLAKRSGTHVGKHAHAWAQHAGHALQKQ